MLEAQKIMFNVDKHSREVSLHYGPVSIVVCDTPEDFADWVQQFVQQVVEQLNVIADELKEYHED